MSAWGHSIFIFHLLAMEVLLWFLQVSLLVQIVGGSIDENKDVYNAVKQWWDSINVPKPLKCQTNFPPNFQKDLVSTEFIKLNILIANSRLSDFFTEPSFVKVSCVAKVFCLMRSFFLSFRIYIKLSLFHKYNTYYC